MSILKSIGSKSFFFLFAFMLAGSALAARNVAWLNTTSDVGKRHIYMYEVTSANGAMDCKLCHNKAALDATTGFKLVAPALGFDNVDMGGSRACSSCHGNGIFLAKMPKYKRCSDCHDVGGDGGGWGGGWGR